MEKLRKASPRVRIGLVLVVIMVTVLVLVDPAGTFVLGKCLFGGEGRYFGESPPKEFTVDYFGNRYIGTSDNVIDWYVFVMGGWERHVLAAMEDVLELTDPDGGVVIDIGANVGTHAIYMSSHATTVHAVEPWPTVLDRMDAMVKASKIDNVVIHPVGFAEEAGTLPFNLPPGENLGMGTFSREIAEQRKFADGGQIDLPLVVGDDYFAEKKIDHVDMVKIDIEGYEKGALRGMAKTLRRDRPVVFMELNVESEEGFHSEEELRSVFPKDYRFFTLTGPPMYDWKLPGEKILACGNPKGIYNLEPFPMNFDTAYNIVAMPEDEAARLDELPDRARVSK